ERLADALRALAAALAESGRPAMIIGGIAAIVRGVPRVTRDIDATVVGEGTDLDALLATFGRHGVAPRIDDALAFARRHHVLLLRHRSSGVDVDVSIAWLPFEVEAIAAAEPIALYGATVRAARAEDLVVYKAVAWRAQDRLDVERLLALHGDRIDLARVRRLVADVAAALDDSGRVAEFEGLIARARGGQSWPGA
ncbi:MAG: nucleotidyltransferase, partial [Myxococcota bacterium]|nr:nucleotidyltransferase [Myxococcota bacterium]